MNRKIEGLNIFIEGFAYKFLELKANLDKSFLEYCIDLKILEYSQIDSLKFNYVGFIGFGENIAFVLPKYIQREFIESSSDSEILDEVNFYLDVIEKSKREYSFYFGDDSLINEVNGSKLKLLLDVLKNYFSSGIYNPLHEVKSNSFENKVNWNKTVEQITPIILENGLIYPEVIGNRTISNTQNLISELHKEIIIVSFNTIGKYIKGFQQPEFDSIGVFDEYGVEYLRRLVQVSLNETFIEEEIIKLKLIQAYLDEYAASISDEILFLGTSTFYVIWELALKIVLGEKEVKSDLIPNPIWNYEGNKFKAGSRLIPDLLIDTFDVFYILDAKYYIPEFNKGTVNYEPKTESITKQILYELVLRKEIKKPIYNAFIFPDKLKATDNGSLNSFKDDFIKGYVELQNDLPKINIWFIPPKQLLYSYLKGVKYKL